MEQQEKFKIVYPDPKVGGVIEGLCSDSGEDGPEKLYRTKVLGAEDGQFSRIHRTEAAALRATRNKLADMGYKIGGQGKTEKDVTRQANAVAAEWSEVHETLTRDDRNKSSQTIERNNYGEYAVDILGKIGDVLVTVVSVSSRKIATFFYEVSGDTSSPDLARHLREAGEYHGKNYEKVAEYAGKAERLAGFVSKLLYGLFNNIAKIGEDVSREEARDISGFAINPNKKREQRKEEKAAQAAKQEEEKKRDAEIAASMKAENDRLVSRRRFLKLAGAGLASMALGKLYVDPNKGLDNGQVKDKDVKAFFELPKKDKAIEPVFLPEEKREIKDTLDVLDNEASREQAESKIAKLQIAQPTFFEKMTGKLDITSVRQIKPDDGLNYGISKESYKKMFEARKYEFRTPGKPLHEGMKTAIRDMGPWMKDLRKNFEDAYHEEFGDTNIKDDFFDPSGRVKEPYLLSFLAIVESNWTLNDVNKEVGVVGAWQFLPSTAKAGGLRITASVDERFDPILAGKLAAKNLFAMYKKFGSWDLSFCGYNGGHVWRYFKGKKKEDVSHFGFVEYLLGRINEEKKLFRNNQCFVRAKDTTRGLAKRFEMEESSLCKLNGLRPGQDVSAGSVLKVKILNKDRAKIFERVMGGYIENIKYGITMRALLSALNDIDLKKLMNMEKDYGEIQVQQPSRLIVEHKVKKGDTADSIGRRYYSSGLVGKIKDALAGKSFNVGKDILGYNKLSEKDDLYEGQVLKVPLREKTIEYKTSSGETLQEIAKKLEVSVWHLAQANRHLHMRQEYKAGEKLKITLKPVTLETLSGGNPQRFDAVAKRLNVAILNPSAAIPDGQRVRLPKPQKIA